MRRMLSKLLISIGSLCSVITPVFANAVLPKQARVPGGVAIIDLDVISQEPPEVRFRGNRTCVLPNPKEANKWLTVIGLPLDIALGANHIEITTNDITHSKEFSVKAKTYPIERLTIADKRKVEPTAEDQAAIEKEYVESRAAYAQWEYKELKSLRLSLPAPGRKSSPFGLQRIMNNIPKNPHSGLDIAAIQGTKVKCPKDGKVINIGNNYFYSGNIVFVDHGQGFITSYCHLNSIAVKHGQILKEGDLIGTVGKTGRATGAHLHWSVSLNNVRVDPQLFIDG